ncbi:hypothetical protein LJR219_002435 [Phenylobacterium sp. LjRoot219]|uniref:hypothetical protein n=1 Tax=Phenylobacterium sp. LjRoot219 TaxID=3342283 RepID=UPI003ED0AB22
MTKPQHPDQATRRTPRDGRPTRRAAVAGFALSVCGLGAVALAKKLDAESGAAPAPAAPTPASPAPAPPAPRNYNYEVLEVGPGKKFKSLTEAGAFMNSEARWNNGYAGADKISRMAFRVVISPGPAGYYVNDAGSRSRRWTDAKGWPPYDGNLLGPVLIEGEAGKPAPVLETDGYGDGVIYYQKGLFATGNFDATFRHLAFRGFRRRDGNGNYAAIRMGDSFLEDVPNRANILIEDCEFTGCDNGIMGGAKGQRVAIRNSYFHRNGNQTGLAHNIYVLQVDELTVDGLLSSEAIIGHLLKTRAARTVVRNSRLLGGDGSESACLDAPNAGALVMDGVVCEKSVDSDATWLIHYAGENQDGAGMPFHQASSVQLRNLTLLAPPALIRHPSSPVVGFANQSGDGAQQSGAGSRLVSPQAENVEVYGLNRQTAGVPCRVLPQRPAVDRKPPIATMT